MRVVKIIAAIMAFAMLISVLPAAVTAEGGKTARITIQYRDEEQNVIRENKTLTETYNDGDTYSVPESFKADFAVKAQDGYNLYKFNPGKSELSAPFADSMTITLVFNNTEQYDYYEDFEDYELDLTKWNKRSQDSVPNPTIETDNTKYIKHATEASTTGGYMKFDEIDTAAKTVHIAADVKFTAPTEKQSSGKKGNSQFAISNTSPSFSSSNITYGINSSSDGHIIVFEYNGETQALTVNGESIDKAFVGDWMHFEADVNFSNKSAQITVSNNNGLTKTIDSGKIFSSAFAGNIGSFYMRSAGKYGSVSADNIMVKITGEGGEIVPDVESVINYKSVYAFGDSIVYGHNSPNQSFMRLIANDYAMNLSMLAKNGATIIKSDNWIFNQVKNAPADAPDFVVFDGYTNDAYESVMSNLGTQQGPSATAFDNTTFCGAFEETLYTIKQKWPESNIVFITIHKSGGRDWDIQNKLRDLSLEMCKAWGVSVADVFNDTTLDTRDANQMKKYIINGAGSHPNVEACREFYIPVIVKTMENALNNDDTEPTIEPTTEPTIEPTTEPTIEPSAAPSSDKVTKITAEYNQDGSLKSVTSEQVDKSEVEDTVNTPANKVFYWDSLEGMKPLAKGEAIGGN